MIELSENLKGKIASHLQSSDVPELFWDYDQGISGKTLAESMAHEYPLNELSSKVQDWNEDNIYTMEVDHLTEALNEFRDDICAELQISSDDFNARELARELRDEFLDLLTVDFNLKDLLRGAINVRIELNSNNDCINSHWLENSTGYNMDGYFGDVVANLKLDPSKVKRMLIERGVKVHGAWPRRTDKNALISYEAFWQEIENRSCGANLLTFVGKVDIYKLLSAQKDQLVLVIPKGNYAGFFSSFQGGGSTMEAELLKDVTIDLAKPWGKTDLDKFRLVIDSDRDIGYSIDQTYGVTSGFWRKEIKIISSQG